MGKLTEVEYDHYLKVIEGMMHRKDLTPEERSLYGSLVCLVEQHEAEHYPMDRAAPYEILEFLLENAHLQWYDLAAILSLSKETVQALLKGEIPITEKQAQVLGGYFKVSPELFLEEVNADRATT